MGIKSGTISDREIKTLCDKGELITQHFEERNIKQSCYELRASNIYYEINSMTEKKTLLKGQYILLKPKQIIVVITKEELYLPKDILGRILSKGSLFSIGISPVNTYADPGFRGKLGIVLNNLSNNYLKIDIEQSIAKIEFSRLEQEVSKPYSGQHGYETEIWPMKNDMILTEKQIKNDDRIGDIGSELELSYGKDLAKAIQKVNKYERKVLFTGVVYFFFMLLIIGFSLNKDCDVDTVLSPMTAVFVGVLSNIIFAISTQLFTNFKR